MESIFGDLAQSLRPEAVGALSRRLGVKEDATTRAVAAALPLLVIALARKAASPEGAESLLAALERDHDGSLLDDPVGALEAAPPATAERIVECMLGATRRAVETQIGRRAGLDAASAGRILVALAPLVIAALARARRRVNWTALGLAYEIGVQRAGAEDAVPGSVGLFEELLDGVSNGDVESGDDVTRVGAEILSRFRDR